MGNVRTDAVLNLSFTADTKQAQAELNKLGRNLSNIINTSNKQQGLTGFTKEIQQASIAAATLQTKLKEATNVGTGKLDISKFSQSLKQSGTNLEFYRKSFSALGASGREAFATLAQSITMAELPLRRTNALLTNFLTTLKNTAKWQISSTMLHGFMGTISQAYHYAQDLNESLNNIRIVTGKDTEEMAKFAKEANAAAQALNTTTTAYTNASLIYYQQGLSTEEVRERTDVTVKMANVTREAASDVSQQLTAVWNNFAKAGDNLEYYADVMTALGAATASSSSEISEGLEKFAAVADTVGLSYEYATAALATVTATTRQSADVVGNAFKTLFARLEGLKLGETLEDGTDLNKYSEALYKVGIDIKDVNGEMKDMDDLLDEMGTKWTSLGKDQQLALAQTVAGVRQYTQLVALMDNWDFFESNVDIARSAEGTLQEQADIYAESWEASKDRVKAALQEIYSQLIDDSFFIDLNNTLEKTIHLFSDVIDSIGGVKSVLLYLSTFIVSQFRPQIGEAFDSIGYNLMMLTPMGKKAVEKFRLEANEQVKAMFADNINYGGKAIANAYASQANAQNELIKKSQQFNAEQQNIAKALLDQHNILVQNVIEKGKEVEELEEEYDLINNNINASINKDTRSNMYQKNAEKKASFIEERNLAQNELNGKNLDLLTTPSSQRNTEEYKNLQTEVDNLKNKIAELNTEIKKLDAIEKNITTTSIKKLQDLAREYLTLSQKAESYRTVLHGTFDKTAETDIEGQRQNLKYLIQSFDETAVSVTNVKDDIINAFGEVGYNALVEFEKVLNTTDVSEKDVAQAVYDLINSMEVLDGQVGQLEDDANNLGIEMTDLIPAETIEKARKLGTEIGNNQIRIEQLRRSQENYRNSLNEIPAALKTAGQSLSDLSMGIMGVVTALNAYKNLKDIVDDDSLSSFEKFTKALPTVAMALPMVISSIPKLITGIKGIGLAISSLWAACPPLVVIIFAIAAAVTAAVVAYNNINKALNENKKALEDNKKILTSLKSEYDEITKKAEEFKSAISDYQEGIDSLETLNKSTKEYAETLEEINKKAEEIIEKFNLIKDIDYFTKNGVITITDEGIEKKNEQLRVQGLNSREKLTAQEAVVTQLGLNQKALESERKLHRYAAIRNDSGEIDQSTDMYKLAMEIGANQSSDYIRNILKEKGYLGLENVDKANALTGNFEGYREMDKYGVDYVMDEDEFVKDVKIITDSIMDYNDSIQKMEEANEEYTKKLLSLEVEEKYGNKIKDAATNEDGVYNASRAKAYETSINRKVAENEAEISNLRESLKNTAITDTKDDNIRQYAQDLGLTGYDTATESDIMKQYYADLWGISADNVIWNSKNNIATDLTGAHEAVDVGKENEAVVAGLISTYLKDLVIQEKMDAATNVDADKEIDAVNNALDYFKEEGSKFYLEGLDNVIADAITNGSLNHTDFSALVNSLSPEQLQELANSNFVSAGYDDKGNLLYNTAITRLQEAGVEGAEDFTNKLNEAIQNYDFSAYRENLIATADEAASSAQEIFEKVQSGDLTATNIREDEGYNKLVDQAFELLDTYPELEATVRTLNQEGLVGTEAWANAVLEVRERYNELAKEQREEVRKDVGDKLNRYASSARNTTSVPTNVVKSLELSDELLQGNIEDAEEFRDILEEIADADYDIQINVTSDLEEEFDNIKSSIKDIADGADLIGEGFVVAKDDVMQLESTFPGIIDGYEDLHDGTIKLKEENVKRAQESAKAQIVASIEEQKAVVLTEALKARARQKAYQQAADSLEAYINGSITGEQAQADIEASLNEQNIEQAANAAEAEIKAQKDVTDESNLNAGILADNYAHAYGDVIQSAYTAAVAQNSLSNAVANGEEIPDYSGEKSNIFSTYTGKEGTSTESDVLNEYKNRVSEIKSQYDDLNEEQQAAINETWHDLQSMADEAGKAANEYESMLIGLNLEIEAIDGKFSKKKSGSDKKNEEKEFKAEIDRYWDLDNAIKATANDLDKLNEKMSKAAVMKDHLAGNKLIKAIKDENANISKQIKLLDNQTKNYKAKLKEQRQELKEITGQKGAKVNYLIGTNPDADLSKLKLSDFGAAVNKDGKLKKGEYDRLLRENAEAMTKATEAYNNSAQTDFDKKAYEYAQKRYETLEALLEKYRKLYYDDIRSTEADIAKAEQEELEKRLEKAANNIEAREIKLQVKLDAHETKRNFLEFRKQIETDFRKSFSDLTIDAKVGKQTVKTYKQDFNAILKDVNAYSKELERMNKENYKAKDIGKFGTKADTKKLLQEAYNSLIEKAGDAQSAAAALWDTYISGIDQTQQKFSDLNNEYDRMTSKLDHQKKLIELLYGDKAYSKMDKYYKGQEQITKNKIVSLQKEVKTWSDIYEARLKEHEAEGVNRDDITTWTEDVRKAYDNMIDAQSSLNTEVEDMIQLFKDDLLNAVDIVTDKLNKDLFGTTLDKAKEDWDFKQNNIAGEYNDDYQRGYKVQSLANKIDKGIAEATSLKAQEKLQKLRDEEIKTLREKETLTQDDLDLAEARYQLALKEIALEDAQNQKNSMKLTRNAEGNWSYQYVADEDKLADKQQDLLDAGANLYEIAIKAEAHAGELYLNLVAEFEEKIKDAIANNATQEDLKKIAEQYEPLIKYAADNQAEYRRESIAAGAKILGDVAKQDAEYTKTLSENQNDVIDKSVKYQLDDYEKLREAIYTGNEALYPGIRAAAEQAFNETNVNSSTVAGQMIDTWSADNGTSVKAKLQEAFVAIQQEVSTFKGNIEDLNTTVDGEFDDITGNIDEATSGVNSLNTAISNLAKDAPGNIDKLKNKFNETKDIVNDLLSKIDSLEEKMSGLGVQTVGDIDNPLGGDDSVGNGESGDAGGGAPTEDADEAQSSLADVVAGHILYYEGQPTAAVQRWGAMLEQVFKKKKAKKKRANIIKKLQNVMSGKATLKKSKEDYEQYDIETVRAMLQEDPKTKFDTGGYTGSWDSSGRLAVLHQKELVLNSDDTANMLQAVTAIRDLTKLNDSIDSAIAASIGQMALSLVANNGSNIRSASGNSNTNNTFNITAEFPNASDVESIREAILSLPNLASQFKGQRMM